MAPEGIHRAGRKDRPGSPPTTGQALAPAAKASCASTLPALARPGRRGCRPAAKGLRRPAMTRLLAPSDLPDRDPGGLRLCRGHLALQPDAARACQRAPLPLIVGEVDRIVDRESRAPDAVDPGRPSRCAPTSIALGFRTPSGDKVSGRATVKHAGGGASPSTAATTESAFHLSRRLRTTPSPEDRASRPLRGAIQPRWGYLHPWPTQCPARSA